MNKDLYPVWIEINKKALMHNILSLKKQVEQYSKNIIFTPVIKSNAYGHGIEITAKIIEKISDWIAVNSLWEAIKLINENIKIPIIVLGYTPLKALKEMIPYNEQIRLTIYNIETLEKLNEISKEKNIKFNTHLKVETGTGRQGITFKEIKDYIYFYQNNDNIKLEGILSHFANIEDTTDHSYANLQNNNFIEFIKEFEKENLKIQYKHIACTAATILFENTYYNFVRSGIGIYGLWPSKETYLSVILENKNQVKLQPVLQFKTKIAQIKELPENYFIGYGCSYKTTHKTKIAVLPVGYYDGYDRGLSNKAYTIIRDKRAPVLGRVCMNLIMVDITHIPEAQLEDEVILLGESKNEKFTADDWAKILNTINYEVVTRLNSELPRIVVEK